MGSYCTRTSVHRLCQRIRMSCSFSLKGRDSADAQVLPL